MKQHININNRDVYVDLDPNRRLEFLNKYKQYIQSTIKLIMLTGIAYAFIWQVIAWLVIRATSDIYLFSIPSIFRELVYWSQNTYSSLILGLGGLIMMIYVYMHMEIWNDGSKTISEKINDLNESDQIHISEFLSDDIYPGLDYIRDHEKTNIADFFVKISRRRSGHAFFERIDIDMCKFIDELRSRESTNISPADVILDACKKAMEYKKISINHVFDAWMTCDDESDDILRKLSSSKEKIEKYISMLEKIDKLRIEEIEIRKEASTKSISTHNRAMTSSMTKQLDSVSTDLTAMAQSGKIDMIVGRVDELASITRILKKKSGSVIMIGESGVGKTALAEKLAMNISAAKLGDELSDKRVLSINLGSLISGNNNQNTKSAHENIAMILDEAMMAENVILVIDDFANMSGRDGESLNILSILGSYVSRGGLQIIGTVTAQDYANYLQSNSTAIRQFENINICSVNKDDLENILLSHVIYLEKKWKIKVSFDAIIYAMQQSERYQTEKNEPARTLDILENACISANEEKIDTVKKETINKIIKSKTGIDISSSSEKRSIINNLENKISSRVIGQESAVSAVSAAMRRSEIDLHDDSKPIASFLFLGPTGVGKTELAKALSEIYFGSEDNMLRIDMSEYQQISDISKLIGDKQRPGILTEAVRQKPNTLILLDEIEKAHSGFYSLMLQILDDGRLSDEYGKTVNFKNTIIIATSNVGSREIQSSIQNKEDWEKFKKEFSSNKLVESFSPEFINRFDAVEIFRPLDDDILHRISDIFLRQVASRLDKKGINLKWDREYTSTLIDKYTDYGMGARPLKRAIEENVTNKITDMILDDEISAGSNVRLAKNGIEIEK